jgi:hypothetical protein
MTKFLKHDGSGGLAEEATATSGGAPNAGKIPELDGNGRLTSDMMPTGIGADTASIQASEALAAGDFVNIHNVSGSARIRKADGSAAGKEAHGFVLASVSSGANGTVHFEGLNDQVTGQTPGSVFLSGTTAGQAVAAAPTGAGKVVQSVGVAISATAINVEFDKPILLA